MENEEFPVPRKEELLLHREGKSECRRETDCSSWRFSQVRRFFAHRQLRSQFAKMKLYVLVETAQRIKT